MFALIFKNLWNRRGKHAWLFLELIVVTVLAWQFLDGPIVSFSDGRIPLGYDTDRLVYISVNSLPESNREYIAEENDQERRREAVRTFLAKMRSLENVEKASANDDYNYINSTGRINTGYRSSNLQDSLVKPVSALTFWPGMDFFETYGIGTVDNGDKAESQSDAVPDERALIVTRDYADAFGPEYGRKGCELLSIWNNDTTRSRISTIIENVRYTSFERTNSLILHAVPFNPEEKFTCIVRLKKGTDPASFINSMNGPTAQKLRTGNYYVETAMPYSDIIAKAEKRNGVTRLRSKGLLTTAFFLLSLLLGVVGSFYLQTRQRIQEIGIHRSFGAGQGDIVRLMIGEATTLASIAFIIGDFIYLNFALHYGLASGYTDPDRIASIRNWVTDFTSHFAIVSAIVYALIIVCVCIGTWLPARAASRINPVDALRDE